MDNMNIPDFIDISSEATNEALAALEESKGRGPLTPPNDCASYVAKKKVDGPDGPMDNHVQEWMESCTVEGAYRDVKRTGNMGMNIRLRIRTTSPTNGNRVVFGAKYIKPEELANGKLNHMSLQWLVSLLKATGMLPPDGAIDARLLNLLFPPKGQPGAQSPLTGKSVDASIRQYDNYWNSQLSRKDEVIAFFPGA